MNNPNAKPIDSQKLEKLLSAYCKGKGIILADLSRETGYSRRYFADALRRGALRQPGINFLERECGIKYEEYALTEEKEVPASGTTETSEVNPMSNEVSLKLDKIISLLEQLVNTQAETKGDLSKLGNIEMQQLEYLKAIKDKPSGMIFNNGTKPYVK